MGVKGRSTMFVGVLLLSLFIFPFFVYSSVGSNTNSYLDPLTRSVGDRIYCLVNGICNTTVVGNITINNDLDMQGFDITNVDDVYATTLHGALNWSELTGYPNQCDPGEAVQVIGDTLTCINLSVYNQSDIDTNTQRAGQGPWLYNDSTNIIFNQTYLDFYIGLDSLISNLNTSWIIDNQAYWNGTDAWFNIIEANNWSNVTISSSQITNFDSIQINGSQIDGYDWWVNVAEINETDAYFTWNVTNNTLELWVNGELQQDWGASTTIYQEATFLDNAFFKDLFFEGAGGEGLFINTSVIIGQNLTVQGWIHGNGTYITDVCHTDGTGCDQNYINVSELNISFPPGRAGAQPWLYNDSDTIYFNESFFNSTVQSLSEVKTYEEYINITSSGGVASGQSSMAIDFLITRITVTPSSLTTQYRFEAVKDSNGDIIDKDRIKHTGVWDIEKSIAIDNDYVNISITQANPDDTFSVKITYLDNFYP